MRLRLLHELEPGENRVALIPDGVERLVKNGWEVTVERGAGEASGHPDSAYESAGASILEVGEVSSFDLAVSVGDANVGALVDRRKADGRKVDGRKVPVFVGLFDPLWKPRRAQAHAKQGLSAISLDLVPRITRAQSMDVLSSMATIAGYEAVLLAARQLPQMFPLLMTAAGTLKPARVLVLGAGVAGLQAIGTARRLGGVVEAYDVRPEAIEQIQSMGARAIELDLTAPSQHTAESANQPASSPEHSSNPPEPSPQPSSSALAPQTPSSSSASSHSALSQAADTSSQSPGPVEGKGGYAAAQTQSTARLQQSLLAPYVADADVVITTAAVPGRKSPLLVTAEMVDGMRDGSVVVDLAAERGGNCELTQADEVVLHKGVTILGPTDLVSRCARHASQMFSTNLVTFLNHLAPTPSFEGFEEAMWFDVEDEIIGAMLVSHGGSVVHSGVQAALERGGG